MSAGTPEGVVNFRGIGRLPIAGGGETRPGVLYRSGALAELTDAGVRTLIDLDVRTIIDLRTPAERAQAPNRPLPCAEVVEVPLLEGAMNPEAFQALGGDLTRLPTPADLYTTMLNQGGAAFAQVAGAVAASEGAVLVHCTAGKDRTGVAVALLLDVVGTDRAAVLADYAESQHRLSGAWAERMLSGLAHTGVPTTSEIVALAISSPAPAMATTLERLDRDGGARAYLLAHGLTEGELASLTVRLVGRPAT